MVRAFLAALLLLGCGQVEGFYLPGVAPRKYLQSEQLMVKANTLTSNLTPLQVRRDPVACPGAPPGPRALTTPLIPVLQFDYYNIPFCEPKNGERALPENLGEVLAGERTETSAYQFHTNTSRLCKTACRKSWTPRQVDEYRDFAA